MSDITHPPVKEALKHLERMYSDEELRLAAERREQALVDAEDIVDFAIHEGERRGREEGLEQGRNEGAAATLSTQIIHKFGPLPEWAGSRLLQATETDLKRWTLRVLDAQCIEDIFA